MTVISSTRGNPQATDWVSENAKSMIGSSAREDGETILTNIDGELEKLFENNNVILTGGGTLTYTAGSPSTLVLTAAMTLEINSNLTGATPVSVSIASGTYNFSAAGRMLYAVINRSAGTSVVTSDATSLPAQTSANQEVFIIAKRIGTGGAETVYFRNGVAMTSGQSRTFASTALLPSQPGNANSLLTTDGSNASWTAGPFSLQIAGNQTLNVNSTGGYSYIISGSSANGAGAAVGANGKGSGGVNGNWAMGINAGTVLVDPSLQFYEANGGNINGLVTKAGSWTFGPSGYGGTHTFNGTIHATGGIDNVYSGTYTPTITNLTNTVVNTVSVAQYLRVGNVVTVSGTVDMSTILAANTPSNVTISIPIGNAFSGINQAGGAASGPGNPATNSEACRVLANTGSANVSMDWGAWATANRTFSYTFTYKIQ